LSEENSDSEADEVRELKQKLSELRGKLRVARGELAEAEPPEISPLAPRGGFPDLPVIDGVRFAAVEAGVRYSGRNDVMLASFSAGSTIAGVFTKSSTRAAPVLDCQEKLAALVDSDNNNKGFALLVNSGNANAFTGNKGRNAVKKVTGAVAAALNIPDGNVFSASTGVIGEKLPSRKIIDSIDALESKLSGDAIADAAGAIMTTDTFAKGAAAEVVIDGQTVKIAGIAKGSGMIAPDMATMLVFIFTDAKVNAPTLQRMVSAKNRLTFNCITVDSDTSTSDSLIVAATGKSNVEISSPQGKSGRAFSAALGGVMRELAHQVVRDGEGATKFLQIDVRGAKTKPTAHKVAMAVANSPLVKTAVAGEDPNWGRVVMAIGKSGANVNRDLISIWFGDILVADQGWVSPDYEEDDSVAYMKQQELNITIDLGLGRASATVWTCDLTKQYISINADYRS